MKIFNKLLAHQTILFVLVYSIHCKPNWSYELTRIETENLTPDVLTVDLHRSKISRGVYGIIGTIDLKQDITDDCRLEIELLLSHTGSSGSYVKTPMFQLECTFSEFARKVYKPYFMDTIVNCTENSWHYTGRESMPLTKRSVKFNNCVISNAQWPSYMTPGYYRLIGRYKNQANGSVAFEFTIYRD